MRDEELIGKWLYNNRGSQITAVGSHSCSSNRRRDLLFMRSSLHSKKNERGAERGSWNSASSGSSVTESPLFRVTGVLERIGAQTARGATGRPRAPWEIVAKIGYSCGHNADRRFHATRRAYYGKDWPGVLFSAPGRATIPIMKETRGWMIRSDGRFYVFLFSPSPFFFFRPSVRPSVRSFFFCVLFVASPPHRPPAFFRRCAQYRRRRLVVLGRSGSLRSFDVHGEVKTCERVRTYSQTKWEALPADRSRQFDLLSASLRRCV